jgi:hypothetical protein
MTEPLFTPEELQAHVTPHTGPTPEEAARQLRLDLCGSSIWTTDPITARMKTYISSCKIWRECDECFDRRVNQFEERYRLANFQTGDLRVLILDLEEDMRIIVRQLKRQQCLYWRIPIEGRIVLLFDGEKTDIIGQDELPDFKILAQTPIGKRYTGKLGKKEKAEVPEDKDDETITVTLLKFGKIEKLRPRAIQMAAEEANKIILRPPAFDVQDIEYMCGLVMEEFAKNIHAMGGIVRHKRRERVTVSKRAYLNTFKDRNDITFRDEAISAFNATETPSESLLEQLYAQP